MIRLLLLPFLAAAVLQDPPAPPPIVDCFPGPLVIFFARQSAVIDREAASIVDAAAAIDRGPCGGATLFIRGHTDRGERKGVDRRRAAAVRAMLRSRGVPPKRLRWGGAGAGDPRVARPPGVAERQNQRVEIIFAPPISD